MARAKTKHRRAPPETKIDAESPWLDYPALSRRVGLSVSYLRQLAAEGRGPAQIKIGRLVRFNAADVDQWMLSQQCSGPDTP